MGTNNDEVITKIVRVIAKENNLTNPKITIERGSNKCEGFVGEIVSVTLEDEITKKNMNFVAKIATKDKNVRNAAAIEELFQNEIRVYKTLLPYFEKLQLSAKIPKPCTSIVKVCAAAEEEECIIMEDLKIAGFEMRSSRQLLDETHMKFVLSRFGELHALSFALKILKPQRFQELSSEWKNLWGQTFTKERNGRIIWKLIESANISVGRKGVKNEKFDKNVNNFDKWVTRMVYHRETKYSCFIHGDSWANNLMLKYTTENGQKNLKELKILDWQFCYVAPPVHDLSYIIFSSASKEIFKNLDTFLLIYHGSLTKCLENFNLNVNEIYPLEVLKRQWKQYYQYGFMLGSVIWRLRSVDEKDAIDTTNFSSDDGSTYFDALPHMKFDEDYLAEHLKVLFDYVDNTENGEIQHVK